jgi:uncharacterized protein YbjT (DUF2867 family)
MLTTVREDEKAKVVVVGATGQVGRRVVAALSRDGHEAVGISRSTGVDVVAGVGLDEVLAGVDAVVDVLNTAEQGKDKAVAFFGTTTRNLLDAERRKGVRHHVLLSIVGIDRIEGNAHYAGKREQERLVVEGPVPWTILRATQFFGFAGMVARRTARDGVATVPPLLVQPVDVAEVADLLARTAVGTPQGRAQDLAGPEPMDLVDMARRTLAARGDPTRLRASWRDGPFGVEMAGEMLLPGPEARLGTTTFESWLGRQRPASS